MVFCLTQLHPKFLQLTCFTVKLCLLKVMTTIENNPNQKIVVVQVSTLLSVVHIPVLGHVADLCADACRLGKER